MASMVFSDVLEFVNTLTSAYISTNVAIVADAIKPAVITLLGLYVILWGVASVRGLIQEPITDAAVRLLKIGLIVGVGLQLGHYNELVTDTFFHAPEQLASALTGAQGNNQAIAGLDTILDSGFTIGKAFWDKAGIVSGDFGMYLISLLVWTVTILVTAYAAFLIILAKIALSLIIALGPVFIVSLLFQPTASFFNAWIQQLSNYFILIVLVIAANVFVLTLFQRAAAGAAAIASTAQIDQVFPFLITGGLSFLVLWQLPNMASGLAGGLSLSGYGIPGRVMSLLGSGTRSLAGRAGNLVRTPRPSRRAPRGDTVNWNGIQNRNDNGSLGRGEIGSGR
jgi:type IV secretion system protein VirB6